MNKSKSKTIFENIRRFFRDRFLPHPVCIALIGGKGSGKTTLLQTLKFGFDKGISKPLDNVSAERMTREVGDQDVEDIRCRVYRRHEFRDFLVKNYKGEHLAATQFHTRVVKGAKGAVVLIRGTETLFEGTKEAIESRERYRTACSLLQVKDKNTDPGIRAVILLETDPETVRETSRKALDSFLDDLKKMIVEAGVHKDAIYRRKFQSARNGGSEDDERRAAEDAAELFFRLAEELDKTIWTRIRTKKWMWSLVTVLVLSLVSLVSAGILRGIGNQTSPSPDDGFRNQISYWKGRLDTAAPNAQTWSEWEEHRTQLTNLLSNAWFKNACKNNRGFADFVEDQKIKNDKLAIELFKEDKKRNVDWMSVVGKADPDIVSFGQRLCGFVPLSTQSKDPIGRLCEDWEKAVQAEPGQRDNSPASEIRRTYRLLTDLRAKPDQKDEATKKRKQALEFMLGQILGRFNADTKEPPMSNDGLPQSAATLAESMFPNEKEEWKSKISARRKELVEEQIKAWQKSVDLRSNPKDKSPDAGRLLRKYAPFARSHSENPDFQQATDYVAEVVGPKLIELARTLENALKENNPSEKTLQAGARTLKELRDLCSSIRNDMVQSSPFGLRWESRFADEFWAACTRKDGNGAEHFREFEEMFRWKVLVETVKLRLVNSADEYWVALENDPGLKWDSVRKKSAEDKNAPSMWIVPRPAEFAKMNDMRTSNLGPSGLDVSGGGNGIVTGGPFDCARLFLYVCRKGEKAKRLTKPVDSIPVRGVYPFFRDKDRKGAPCRKIVFVLDINVRKQSEVQCWLYGTESSIRPLQMLEEAKNAGTMP